MTEIQAFFGTQTGIAVYGTLAVTLVAFLSGVAAALRDKVFSWQYIDAFVASHLLKKVVPIFLFLFSGFVVGGDQGGLLTIAGLAAAAAYLTSTVASVLALWSGAEKQGAPSE